MSIQLAVYFNMVKEINDNGIYKGALGPLVFQGGVISTSRVEPRASG